MKWLWYLMMVLVAMPGGAQAQGLAGPLEPRPISAERWTESFTVIADLEGDVYLKVQALVTNVGVGDGKAVCRVLVTRPGREPLRLSQKAGDDWQFDARSETLRVGRCALSNAVDGLRVHAVFDELSLDLYYAARAKRHQVPDGFLSNGDAFYEYDVQLPWASVSANLTEGHAKATVRGFGFVDHSRSTAMPRDIAYRWFRFLGLNDGHSSMFRVRTDALGHHEKGWWWEQGDPLPRLGKPSVVGFSDVPEGADFRFTIHDGKVVYEVHVDELLLRQAPLEELGLMGKMIQPWLGRPETRTYRARVKKGEEQWRGLLEIATNYD
ncbi:MAG: hypothetical protein VX834_10030 [Myxococcota bacterium]|nr:hypothetical protein [Myxococcota bacterium]